MTTDRNLERLNFRVMEESDIDQALDLRIRTCLQHCFPPDVEYFSQRSWWHCRPQWRVIVTRDSGEAIAHSGVVERDVRVGAPARMVMVAGIQSFAVVCHWRGKGVSDRMMQLIIDEARERHLDAGLLFCREHFFNVYNRMGWTAMPTNAFMRDEQGHKVPIASFNRAMVYPLTMEAFPTGDIDLNGPDW